MLAHGAHSELGLIPLDKQRCFALGTPGDPAVPPEAQRFARFCPRAPRMSNYSSTNYSSLNHTQGFAGMVQPLARFLVAAVAGELSGPAAN